MLKQQKKKTSISFKTVYVKPHMRNTCIAFSGLNSGLLGQNYVCYCTMSNTTAR